MCDRTWAGRSLAAFQGRPVGNIPSWDQVEIDFCLSGSSLKFCAVRFGAVGGSVLSGALVTLRLWEQAGRVLPTGKTSENPDLKRGVVVTGSAGTPGPGPRTSPAPGSVIVFQEQPGRFSGFSLLPNEPCLLKARRRRTRGADRLFPRANCAALKPFPFIRALPRIPQPASPAHQIPMDHCCTAPWVGAVPRFHVMWSRVW